MWMPHRGEFIAMVCWSWLGVSSLTLAFEITLLPVGEFQHGGAQRSAAEIVVFDPQSQRLLVINGDCNSLDMLDIREPSHVQLWRRVSLNGYGREATSVAVNGGVIAASICGARKGDRGKVALMDKDGNIYGAVEVGAHPDMVTFTPDGRMLLVANEGEPSDDYSVDPEGSVSAITFDEVGEPHVVELGFAGFNDRERSESVRVFGPDATAAMDFEPEYIAVAPDGQRAWVTLQENNAIAIVDLQQMVIRDVVGLGFKDHALPGNGLDTSDNDGGIRIVPRPLLGMYQPDAIAAFDVDGKTYLITANEGDVRDYPGFRESKRFGELVLAPGTFPNAHVLQLPEVMGNLRVTATLGFRSSDGAYEKVYAFGARSFAIWDENVARIYESGDLLERISEEYFPTVFNSNHDSRSFDRRSIERGPEPEGLAIGEIDGTPYAFLGLERPSAIICINLTEPSRPRICGVYHASMSTYSDQSGLAKDQGPEGLCFIPATHSPTGVPLLAVAFEVSGNTRLFEVRREPAVIAPHSPGDAR